MNDPVNLFVLSRYADDEELAKDLKERGISLTSSEVRRIAEMLGRDPSVVELYIFNGEWSEHCSYKSSKRLLKQLPTTGPTVIMGVGEDAGILELCRHQGKRYGVVVAHESHNHPSQVLPVEGAATGIGGVVRDVACMGARIVGLLDLLRFGDPEGDEKERTRWIVSGVVQGIMEYGNALGVPNLGGDVSFAPNFDDNCLVNVVALGVIEESEIISSAVPKQAADEPYDMILIGKPTDFSGFGGAAFASATLDEKDEQANLGAIQVHDPFLENVLVMGKANHAAFALAQEHGVTLGFKDLGAAGVACAAAEMAAAGGFGVDLNLDLVHTALSLPPEVICLAETQERFLLACPRRLSEEFLRIYNEDWELPRIYEGAAASVVGRITEEKVFRVSYQQDLVANAKVEDVVEGILYDRESKPQERSAEAIAPEFGEDLQEVVLGLVGHINACSRRPIFERYDTEVQGAAVLRSGEADAGVIAPLLDEGLPVGIAVAADGNPHYGQLDPYWGGATAVAEAVRNVIAVGGEPLGLTDCLNYGNPEVPEAFWQLESGVKGIGDAARGLTLPRYPGEALPFVSGNVSLYNESVSGVAVPPSPIVACIGVVEDVSEVITPRLKAPGNLMYLFGARRPEFGGTLLAQRLGMEGGQPTTVDFETESAINHILLKAIRGGFIQSCHDISEGGLCLAAIEMGIMGYQPVKCGIEIDGDLADSLGGLTTMLFSESGGFLAEIAPEQADGIEERFRMKNLPFWRVGTVIDEPVFRLVKDGEPLCQLTLERLHTVHECGLRTLFGG